MRAHYLQHVSFEGPGVIKKWLEKRDYKITGTHFFESPDLPDPADIDFLIIMGGPMSVNDEETFPWFIEEKAFIREVIQSGTPVLGICLGAQLIASACGSKIYPNDEKEIGWFPVQGVSSEDFSLFQFPSTFKAFHWHGETFDLPPQASLLASTNACKHQAYQIGQSVIGLQFHLEMTEESVRKISDHCRDELVPANYIQTEKEMLSAGSDQYKKMHQLLESVLAFLTR